ncbi:MAG: superoxide dismutase [Desulfobacteraceae bacterium]|jgi:Fe-Mn family superoxide dismutase|nr:superoxide dismutase [Desulfobacteraceae bacterium]
MMNRRTFLSTSAKFGGLLLLQTVGFGCQPEKPGLSLTLTPLPYPVDALAPFLSEDTVRTHYEKHHAAYLERTRQLIGRSRSGAKTLAEVAAAARADGDDALFNNAAQALNHELYWQSMKPGGGGEPTGELHKRIQNGWGGYRPFREALLAAAREQFGSGWVWLVAKGGGLEILHTDNAETPAVEGAVVLTALDVWEHAYYLDYRNRRMDYVEAFLDHLVNWDFALRQLQSTVDEPS